LVLTATVVGVGCSTDPGPDGQGGAAGSGGQAPTSGTSGQGPKGGQSGAGGSAGLGSAGSNGTGGSSGGALNCPNVTACGGDVVGTWNVTSSCLKLSGEMDVSATALGCLTVPVNGSLQTTGTFIANADGTFTDNTRTTGSVTFPIANSCLSVSMVPVGCDKVGNVFKAVGWTTAACTPAADGCNCMLTTDHEAGLGTIVAYKVESGPYTIEGNTLTLEEWKYQYCAAGDTLTLTPEKMGLSGTVVLQREGTTPGTGGGAGSGGAASGGASGKGGAASGGTSGAGTAGTSGAGGATGGAGTGGSAGTTAGSAGAAGSTSGGTRPCDIYEAASHTCVAAHSTVRALFGDYSGNLYQVKRASDGTTKDIPVLSPGGFADSAQQESFCMGTTCTILRVYDQSGNGNFLEAETPDSTVGGRQGQTAANAAAESLMVGGSKVYSLYTRPSQAYWRDGSSSGMPLGADPQGIYMVTSGEHFNGGCCYNYGNAQVSRTYEGGPTMDSVYFGNCTIWGSGAGDGPWVMADMEDGIVSGSGTGQNNNLESLPFPYVTAMEKNNGRTEFAIKGADATSPTLKTFYQGALPAGKNPMRKGGAIVLGSGGDCCYSNNNASEGTFYEGAIVSGYPTDATDNAIHANIVEAGYGE
jgi:non-reducing end alpha-L-arabinofuranosidase